MRSTIVLLFAMLTAGCYGDDIKVYRVPKEQSAPPSMVAQASMPPGHPDIGASAQPQLTWKKPEGWSEAPPGEMRVASFNIKGKDGKQADVSVIPLPGGAGGDSANVNRWRGQVGLPPVSPEELKKLAQPVEVAGQPGDLYELSGKNTASGDATRILGTIQHRDGVAWFYKMTGDDEVVAGQKPAFIAFLKSVKFEVSQAAGLPPSHPPMDGMSMPAGHPDIPPATVATDGAASASEGKPKWQVPPGWKEIPGGQFLVAKFVITSASEAQAAVNVSMSAGDGGGLLANVNRWRQQLGLTPVDETALGTLISSLDVAGGKATFVELSGTDARSSQPTRLVGAIVPQAGRTWFYKLMGNGDIVERQKDAFTRFIQTVTY